MYLDTPLRLAAGGAHRQSPSWPPTTHLNGYYLHLGCAWDGASLLGMALGQLRRRSERGSKPPSFEAGFREKRANVGSCIQARNTAPIVNTFARSYAADAKATPTEVTSILEQRIRGVQEESGLAETGRVLSVGYAKAMQ